MRKRKKAKQRLSFSCRRHRAKFPKPNTRTQTRSPKRSNQIERRRQIRPWSILLILFSAQSSIQRDCGLVSCIEGQSMVAMAHGPSHGMFQKSGHSRRHVSWWSDIYACPKAMALHSISSLSEPLHSCPTHPRLYIASFLLQAYVVQTWELS